MTVPATEEAAPPFVANEEAVLRVESLAKHFGNRRSVVRAVDDVSFDLARGETLGLAGESGCGKTTLSRMLLRLIEPTSGRVVVGGQDITSLKGKALRDFRRRAQIVFQDPYASLDPRQRVVSTVAEPLLAAGRGRQERTRAALDILGRMGISAQQAHRYPHQFSGGQRQRIGIARALSVSPEILILDEPVSALDVSIQAQVLKLLDELRAELGLSYILISHDLSVVRHVSERVMVMYFGRIVEMAATDDLYDAPLHPYTESLLSAAPLPDPRAERARERIVLAGDPPNPAAPPSGCAFHERCPRAARIAAALPAADTSAIADGRRVPLPCATTAPTLASQPGQARWVACHFPAA